MWVPNKASLRQKEALSAFQRSLVSDAKKACFQSGGITFRFQCFRRAGKYPFPYASAHVFSPFPPTPRQTKVWRFPRSLHPEKLRQVL